MIQNSGSNRVLTPCDSYYFKRPGYPRCSTLVEGADINKSGTTCTDYCFSEECGGARYGTCVVNPWDSRGFTCKCTEDAKLSPDGFACNSNICIGDGLRCNPNRGTPCCSGDCRYYQGSTIGGVTSHYACAPKGGGGCFTGESMITMFNGSVKAIKDIVAGELVRSGITGKEVLVLFTDKAKISNIENTLVGFTIGNVKLKPFATIDHCFISPGTKCNRQSFDPQRSISGKHWDEVLQLKENNYLCVWKRGEMNY